MDAGARRGRRPPARLRRLLAGLRRAPLPKLFARGLQLEIADIREGCSWVHGDDVAAVTGKAERIVDSSVAYPDAPADTMAYAERRDTVVVIGGGVAGTQAAAELAKMGHHVELIERRPFLGGRAARIGTVFPTNDCGQCLPAGDAQAARASASTATSPSTTRTSPCAAAPRWSPSAAAPATSRWASAACPTSSPTPASTAAPARPCARSSPSEPGHKAIFTEFYDGRVVRTVDLETCTFCGACAERVPRGGHRLRPVAAAHDGERRRGPHRRRLRAGAA